MAAAAAAARPGLQPPPLAPLPLPPQAPKPPSILLRLLLPEIHGASVPGYTPGRSLVVLRLLLYTAPLVLVLDWPAWGLTWVLVVAALAYAILLLAYVRAAAELGGVNPFAMPAATAAKPYYALALVVAAALLLSPVLHAFNPSFRTRATAALIVAAAVVIALFLPLKIRAPGVLGRVAEVGFSPEAVATTLSPVI
jgi:hypothetical protein